MPKAEPKCVLELSKEFGLFYRQAFSLLNTTVIGIFHLYKNITMFWIRTMNSWFQATRASPWTPVGNGSGLKIVWNWGAYFLQNISHYWTITLLFLFWPSRWATSVQHIMYLVIIRIIRVTGISIWWRIVRRILGLTLIVSRWLTPLTSFWWRWI